MPALAKRRFRRSMTFAAAARRRIQQLGPYKSLAVLLIPLLIVEPLKMTGVGFVGLGHWVAGACMIVGGYAAGLLGIERLFRVVKSKLYTIKWCAALASQLQVTRARWRSRRVLSHRPRMSQSLGRSKLWHQSYYRGGSSVSVEKHRAWVRETVRRRMSSHLLPSCRRADGECRLKRSPGCAVVSKEI
jgi:hypothetical protein